MDNQQEFETFVSLRGSVDSLATILQAPIELAEDDSGAPLRFTDVTNDDETHFRFFSYLDDPEHSYILSTDPGDDASLYMLLSQLGVRDESIDVAYCGDVPMRDVAEIRRAVSVLRKRTRH